MNITHEIEIVIRGTCHEWIVIITLWYQPRVDYSNQFLGSATRGLEVILGTSHEWIISITPEISHAWSISHS